jgi:hypothetical protein
MEEQQVPAEEPGETPEEWANRVTGKLRGLLKAEIAACGEAEAFLRQIRYDEDDESSER